MSLILFGKATHRKMIQNLIWATGYNIVALPLAAGVLYAWHILLTPAIGAALMTISTVIVSINASMLRLKDEPKSDSKAEPQTEAKDENKPEAKDESKPETKSEGKDEPMTEAKDDAQPEAKADPETIDEPIAEATDENKPLAKADSETKDEPMAETKDESKTEPQSEVKDETETKTISDENNNIPSTVTPEIVKRVHEFYEELGREDVRAVMDMEKTETKADSHPAAKREPKSKDVLKPEIKANKTSDSTPELVTRVHELYEKLGHGDVSAVQNMDETELEIPKQENNIKSKPELKTEVKVDPEHKDNVGTKIAAMVKSEPDAKSKSKAEVKSGHKQVIKIKSKPGSKK